MQRENLTEEFKKQAKEELNLLMANDNLLRAIHYVEDHSQTLDENMITDFSGTHVNARLFKQSKTKADTKKRLYHILSSWANYTRSKYNKLK